MGYRSNVVITVAADSSEELEKLNVLWHMTEQYKKAEQYLEPPRVAEINTDGKNYPVWIWEFEDVKWYSGYVRVDVYEELHRLVMEEVVESSAYWQVRIGEEREDIVTDGSGNDDLLAELRCTFYPSGHIVSLV